MGDRTGIEWTDATWNPIVGCSIVSPGCTNCYAMKQAAALERRFGSAKYAGLTKASKAGPVWTGAVRLVEDALGQPLSWRRPRRIFVNSMSDLFHENLPDEAIDRVFAVMALCPQHTFQVLTKRAKRMRDYCSDPRTPARVWNAALDLRDTLAALAAQGASWGGEKPWPLLNVWKGVSIEDRPRGIERAFHLANTPAAIRFWSCEPLLGDLGDLTQLCLYDTAIDGRPAVHWVIAGGESGPDARPMHPDWPRALRDQCAEAGVPFFFKQHGDWAPGKWEAEHFKPDDPSIDLPKTLDHVPWANRVHWFDDGEAPDGIGAVRVGKKAAGHLLDGRAHREFPR